MDALIAKADGIQPLQKRRKTSHIAHKQGARRPHDTSSTDRTLHSITKHTSVPKSLGKLPEAAPTHTHIANKKLRAELNRHTAQTARAKALLEDAGMLLADEAGKIEVEGEMERTWRVGQDEIAQGAGQEAAKGRREWKLDGGPYRTRYTRNGRSAFFSSSCQPLFFKKNHVSTGRHLAISGRTGHVATFDWMTGTLHSELQLQETCRDITYVRPPFSNEFSPIHNIVRYLHDHSHYAVAQKKYVFIYDRDGVELHCLRSHIEPTRLEFLPYHWLLASIVHFLSLSYILTS